MSARKAHYAIVRQLCDAGISPNRYIPHITCEIRVFHPPHIPEADIRAVIDQALDDIKSSLQETTE